MKYILALWVIVVLIGVFFISLINLPDYGANGLILAGISAFALYKVFKFLLSSDDSDDFEETRTSGGGGLSTPAEYIFFGDMTETGDDDW